MQIIKNLQELNKIKNEYNNICNLLTYQEVLMDAKLCLNYQKQKNVLEPIALKYMQIEKFQNDLKELENLKLNANDEEKVMYEQEILKINNSLNNLQNIVLKLLAEFNAKNSEINVEILSKQNNNKLLLDLIKGYTNFCKQNCLTCNPGQIKNGISLQISGLNAKEYFLGEVGIHSVQDESSSCQVFVIDNSSLKNDYFSLDDVEISTMRSSGAGGQHVNTTDSAIRATHKKTGLACVCQNERSQFQNKQKAIDNLKQKVKEFYLKQSEKNYLNQKKLQLKIGLNKIYNYDQNLILKQNKINDKNKKIELNLKEFLQGNIL